MLSRVFAIPLRDRVLVALGNGTQPARLVAPVVLEQLCVASTAAALFDPTCSIFVAVGHETTSFMYDLQKWHRVGTRLLYSRILR